MWHCFQSNQRLMLPLTRRKGHALQQLVHCPPPMTFTGNFSWILRLTTFKWSCSLATVIWWISSLLFVMQWQKCTVITGPPNGPVLFSSLASVGVSRRCLLSSSVVCNTAGGPGTWAVGWPTLHGGPVRLRPVRRHLVCYQYNKQL